MKRRAFLAAVASVVPLSYLKRPLAAKVVIPDGRKYPIFWPSGTSVSHRVTAEGKHEVTAVGLSKHDYWKWPKVPNGFCRTIQEREPIGDSDLWLFKVVDIEIQEKQ